MRLSRKEMRKMREARNGFARTLSESKSIAGLSVATGLIAGLGSSVASAAPDSDDLRERAIPVYAHSLESAPEATDSKKVNSVPISAISGGEFEITPVKLEVIPPSEPEPTVVSQETLDSYDNSYDARSEFYDLYLGEISTSESSGSEQAVLNTALSYVGAPYRWSGVTPSGWDCIGFVRYVYAQHGVSIGGSTTSVLSVGRRVPYSEAQVGDILYWPGHVAIYAGNGQNIGAWNPSMGTTVGPNSWLGTPVVIRVFE